MTFDGDKGFAIKELTRKFTETEQAIVKAMNNARSALLSRAEIEAACPGINARTLLRALSALVSDGVLTREGENRDTRYGLVAGRSVWED